MPIQKQNIGKHTPLVADFGTGDIVVISALDPEIKDFDNMVWFIQDKEKPPQNWDLVPYTPGQLSDELPGDNPLIVFRFGNAKSLANVLHVLQQVYNNMDLYEKLKQTPNASGWDISKPDQQ